MGCFKSLGLDVEKIGFYVKYMTAFPWCDGDTTVNQTNFLKGLFSCSKWVKYLVLSSSDSKESAADQILGVIVLNNQGKQP